MERHACASPLRSNRTKFWRLASPSGLLAVLLLAFVCAPAADFPEAEIGNGTIKAHLLLPDVRRGYYRGSRFDWGGAISSLTFKGHEFFGKWFDRYDPLLHDAIMGPVEEFRSADGALGYSEAKAPNGLFMKIGVGILRKPWDEPYNFARGYSLVNPGRRVVRLHKDGAEFVHELDDGEGYAYQYTKVLRLPRGKAQLIIEHTLKNTGKRTIDTEVYNHDFFMLDHKPTGPDTRVIFPFKPQATFKSPGEVEGNEIRYTSEVPPPPASVAGEVTGFSDSARDNEVRVENTAAGIGVRESGDQPPSKLFFWSIHTTVCPEFYIKIHVEPRRTFKWRIVYDFYLLDAPAGTKTKVAGEGTS